MKGAYQPEQRTARSWQAMKNNAQGNFFEGYIKAACRYYQDKGVAVVEKMPEPFKTTSTNRDGTFTGRFIANAQPDFMETLRGGQAICFEAKYTSTDKIKQSVITQTQWESLERHWAAGAMAGVCVGIGDIFGFIPWGVWRGMKEIYGHKHMTKEDLEPYRVKFNGLCLFLDYLHPGAAADLPVKVQLDEAETKLEAVLGADLGKRLAKIIQEETVPPNDWEKMQAFMDTTLEAAIGGADYSACTTLEDMAGVYAAWLVDKHF